MVMVAILVFFFLGLIIAGLPIRSYRLTQPPEVLPWVRGGGGFEAYRWR